MSRVFRRRHESYLSFAVRYFLRHGMPWVITVAWCFALAAAFVFTF